jgi:hypothetical protein
MGRFYSKNLLTHCFVDLIPEVKFYITFFLCRRDIFSIHLGHFIAYALFSYVTITQA